MKKFVGVDGESYTVEGDHRYVLIADSTGRYEYESKGLSTIQCFEFLLSLPIYSTPVAFGWNYDVNMMLRDFDTETLLRLWHEGRVGWHGYQIEWIPNKWLYLKHGKHSARISDAFGFFQTSFVNALRKWEIEPQSDIEAMKSERSLFDPTMKRRIIEYCIAECQDLVSLMDELEIALSGVDLSLRSWVGAGSIASALLTREGVREHHSYDSEFPDEVNYAIRRAYFGGRTELFKQGEFPRLWDYDISSAYPAEAYTLPSLRGVEWTREDSYIPSANDAIWEVSWECDPKAVIMPFPFRNGSDILYPSNGKGWYHACEVREAIAYHGDAIEVTGGYVLHSDGPGYHQGSGYIERPFTFVDRLYRHRAELKRNGHGGEKVLKLGLNAIYGKLAQGYGYRGKPPPFQSYYWAGRITAGTRSRIMRMGTADPDSLVMVATDGIFFDRDVDPDKHTQKLTGLGGIELTVMEDVFVAQPGVYSAVVDGERIGRSRGFFSREIDFDDLRRGFRESGPYYKGSYNATRFCGIGASLVNRDLSTWRKWKESTRTLSLFPSRKFLAKDATGINPVVHLPSSLEPGLESDPYRPKLGNVKLADEDVASMVEYLEGTEQPLRDYG